MTSPSGGTSGVSGTPRDPYQNVRRVTGTSNRERGHWEEEEQGGVLQCEPYTGTCVGMFTESSSLVSNQEFDHWEACGAERDPGEEGGSVVLKGMGARWELLLVVCIGCSQKR